MADAGPCAVGRIGPDGPWIGFSADEISDYVLVLGGPAGERRAHADADVLLSLAIAYFEEALDEPPDELAATHADIAALVRHFARRPGFDTARQAALRETVDAIDDGAAADVVIARLTRALSDDARTDPLARLLSRARSLAGDD